jgi:DnaJ domain
MTPDEAAAVLGIHRDAGETEIDHAYRRLARELHPDRSIGASASASAVRAASDRFVEVTRAREVLLRSAAVRTQHAATSGSTAGGTAGSPTSGTGVPTTHPDRPVYARPDLAASAHQYSPFSWMLFGAWTLLLAVGAVFVLSGAPVWGPLDLWLRVALLVASAIVTALTRRRWAWRATLVLIGLSAIATVLATTFGGLLGLGMMIVACFGLAVQARLVRFPDH